MATFVHLTPAARAPAIRRSGIKARGERGGVHLFPVLPSYALTHQWVREPARRPGPGGSSPCRCGCRTGSRWRWGGTGGARKR
ncbi:hypothetical protein ACFWF9_10980 [Streptomyces roseolus]|uniref:hypothetical protein n=1 Tax=Streptomyces roseolus TaxID=67358 RepID=UPI0036651CCE